MSKSLYLFPYIFNPRPTCVGEGYRAIVMLVSYSVGFQLDEL